MGRELPDELSKVVQSERKRKRIESEATALGVSVDAHLADVTRPDQHSEEDAVRRYVHFKTFTCEEIGQMLGHLKLALGNVKHLSELAGDDLAVSYFSDALCRDLESISDVLRSGEYHTEKVEDSDDQA